MSEPKGRKHESDISGSSQDKDQNKDTDQDKGASKAKGRKSGR